MDADCPIQTIKLASSCGDNPALFDLSSSYLAKNVYVAPDFKLNVANLNVQLGWKEEFCLTAYNGWKTEQVQISIAQTADCSNLSLLVPKTISTPLKTYEYGSSNGKYYFDVSDFFNYQ